MNRKLRRISFIFSKIFRRRLFLCVSFWGKNQQKVREIRGSKNSHSSAALGFASQASELYLVINGDYESSLRAAYFSCLVDKHFNRLSCESVKACIIGSQRTPVFYTHPYTYYELNSSWKMKNSKFNFFILYYDFLPFFPLLPFFSPFLFPHSFPLLTFIVFLSLPFFTPFLFPIFYPLFSLIFFALFFQVLTNFSSFSLNYFTPISPFSLFPLVFFFLFYPSFLHFPYIMHHFFPSFSLCHLSFFSFLSHFLGSILFCFLFYPTFFYLSFPF